VSSNQGDELKSHLLYRNGSGESDAEDILDMRSEVESPGLPASGRGASNEEGLEKNVTKIALPWEDEESAELEEEGTIKTGTGAKSAHGLEVETEEQIVDDSVRMYLHEIGKVSLLTASEEKTLASKIEEAKYLEKIEKLYFRRYSEYPPAAHIVVYLLRHLVAAQPMVNILAERLELAPTTSFIQRILDPKLRAAIDGVIDQELIQSIAEVNDKSNSGVAQSFIGLSLDSRLLPPELLEIIGDMPLLDLIQEGNIGLVRAVEKFEYRRGYKFSTYATWWIRQAITRAIADQSRTIRIPVHMVEIINRLLKTSRRLAQEYGREPSCEEIGKGMEISSDRVRAIMKLSKMPISLEMPIGEEGDSYLSDFIEDRSSLPPADAASRELLKAQLNKILSELTDRERRVIVLRFGLEDGRARTLEEVGKEFNVTRERIRQIEAKALRKLRHPSRSRKLKDYLE